MEVEVLVFVIVKTIVYNIKGSLVSLLSHNTVYYSVYVVVCLFVCLLLAFWRCSPCVIILVVFVCFSAHLANHLFVSLFFYAILYSFVSIFHRFRGWPRVACPPHFFRSNCASSQ